MVYQATTKSLIEGVISGYNATVFAYGPTGEGEQSPRRGLYALVVPSENQAPLPSTAELVWPQPEQGPRTWLIKTTLPQGPLDPEPHPQPRMPSSPLPPTSLAIWEGPALRTDPGLPGAPAHPPPCSAPGCGKTYTMLGTDHEPGIYIRTLNDLFCAIEETSNDMEYEVSMSYLEVGPPSTLSRGLGQEAHRTGLAHLPVTGQFPGVLIAAALPCAYGWPHFLKTEAQRG